MVNGLMLANGEGWSMVGLVAVAVLQKLITSIHHREENVVNVLLRFMMMYITV